MNDASFEALCRSGESADRLCGEGRHAEAEQAYLELFKRIRDGEEIDSFLVAKVTLGLILTRLRAGKLQAAFDVWTQDPGESLLGLGVQFIEDGQVSAHDALVYDLVCAYFHSLSGEDPEGAAEAVLYYMTRVCAYAERRDSRLLPLVVVNWRQYLRELHGEHAPEAERELVDQLAARHGIRATHGAVAFPDPSAWTIDWTDSDGQLTVFRPDGSVQTITESDYQAKKKKKRA
jgi:hypothetical protein